MKTARGKRSRKSSEVETSNIYLILLFGIDKMNCNLLNGVSQQVFCTLAKVLGILMAIFIGAIVIRND